MTVNNEPMEDRELEHTPLGDLVRKVMLAGIGAAALAQEEAEAFVQKLIEKGELAEKDGRTLIRDMREKRRQKTQEHLDKRISRIIERMNIPTKADLEILSKKITELNKKVDELKN